jgi:branched-chain amino acid transport system ATP-binding protein
MLEMRDTAARYGSTEALKAVSLTVAKGEIVCLIGSNGAGKSTLLNIVSGVVRSASGEVLFEGASIVGRHSSDIVRRGIVQVPEGRQVFPDLTVFENLEMGAYSRPVRNFADNVRFVFDLFPRISERRNQLAGLLSGGEQQMLAIARALMAEPRLLLLDEPSMGLAPLVIADIFRVLGRLRKDLSLTILLVEQNARAALKLADRGYVLVNGHVAKAASCAELSQDPEIQDHYLGKKAKSFNA